MTYTLVHLDRVIKNHLPPASVAATVPGLTSRRRAVVALARHRDQVYKWAVVEANAERNRFLATAEALERELLDVLDALVADYSELGVTVRLRLEDLEAAWSQASDNLHQHQRDEAILGPHRRERAIKAELEGTGMIENPGQPVDPLIEAGIRIREELKRGRGLQHRIEHQRQKAEAVDVYDVDARYVDLLDHYLAKGMVVYPTSSTRPALAQSVVTDLAEAGIDLNESDEMVTAVSTDV